MEELTQENLELKNKIIELEEKLKKYSNPKRNKTFYENHKEEIKKMTREYRKNLDKDKIKEYNRRAYLKRKEKNEKT